MLILFLPYGQNLVHVDLAVVVLQDLGDCADRVLCRVDVLRLPALGLGDNLQRKVKLRWCKGLQMQLVSKLRNSTDL